MKNLRITVNGNVYDVQVEETSAGSSAVAPAISAPAAAAAPAAQPAPSKPAASVPAGAAGSTSIEAPMPGAIVGVSVKPGDSVKEGDVLLVLEAMKMENEIMAPKDGVVATVEVRKGDNVDSGQILVTMQ